MSSTPHVAPSFSRRSFLGRSALTVGVAAAGSSVLTACNSPVNAKGGGGKSGRMTYLSPIPVESLSLAAELLAVAGGYFKKHGLDVTLQPAKGTAQAIQTMVSGIAPITRAGQIDVMSAVMSTGQPLVNIGTQYRTSTVRFVYSKKNHPLLKPQDLLGQKMGVPSVGGTSDKVVSLVLASAGLDPAKTERQVVGLTPGTFNLVQRGRLAGYVVSIDTANIVLSQHPDAGVFDPTRFVKSDTQVYTTTKKALAGQSGDLRSYLAAIREAMTAINADTELDDTLKVLRRKYHFATLDNDAIAKASLNTMRSIWSAGGPGKPLLVTDAAAWARGYKELSDAKLVKAGGDPASWMDNSLLPQS